MPYKVAPHSRSSAASLSRAVRRLEDRGLVQRRNQRTGDRHQEATTEEDAVELRRLGWRVQAGPNPITAHARTTHLRLTEAGAAVAKEITEAVNNARGRQC